ncbi:hypothetical protein [Aeromonas dhakensis]|uniref:hypothetical protein n=1 Tax=Aeromonas dhakensis TaxID=196024 RepID=UPI003BA3461D
MQAYALKRLYDTMVISYYDQVGGLQGQDEYGYGTHDIDTLLSVKEVKSYVLPTKLIIVGIKDENGDMIVIKATNLQLSFANFLTIQAPGSRLLVLFYIHTSVSNYLFNDTG